MKMKQILTRVLSALILLKPLMAKDDILHNLAAAKQMGCYTEERGELFSENDSIILHFSSITKTLSLQFGMLCLKYVYCGLRIIH